MAGSVSVGTGTMTVETSAIAGTVDFQDPRDYLLSQHPSKIYCTPLPPYTVPSLHAPIHPPPPRQIPSAPSSTDFIRQHYQSNKQHGTQFMPQNIEISGPAVQRDLGFRNGGKRRRVVRYVESDLGTKPGTLPTGGFIISTSEEGDKRKVQMTGIKISASQGGRKRMVQDKRSIGRNSPATIQDAKKTPSRKVTVAVTSDLKPRSATTRNEGSDIFGVGTVASRSRRVEYIGNSETSTFIASRTLDSSESKRSHASGRTPSEGSSESGSNVGFNAQNNRDCTVRRDVVANRSLREEREPHGAPKNPESNSKYNRKRLSKGSRSSSRSPSTSSSGRSRSRNRRSSNRESPHPQSSRRRQPSRTRDDRFRHPQRRARNPPSPSIRRRNWSRFSRSPRREREIKRTDWNDSVLKGVSTGNAGENRSVRSQREDTSTDRHRRGIRGRCSPTKNISRTSPTRGQFDIRRKDARTSQVDDDPRRRIQRFAERKDVVKIMEIFRKDIFGTKLQREIGLYNAVLDALSKCSSKLRHTKGVKEVYESMRKLNLDITATTRNLYIKALKEGKDYESIFSFFDEIKDNARASNLVTFEEMMRLCRRLNKPDRALELTEILSRNQSGFGDRAVAVFTSGVDYFAQAGRLGDAMFVFRMVPPASRTRDMFVILLRACKELSAWRQALVLYGVMVADGLRPSKMTYQDLIAALFLGGKYDRGFTLMQNMALGGINRRQDSRDIHPQAFYHTLLASCGNQPEVAIKVFQRFLGDNLVPQTISYDLFIECCEKANNWHAVTKLTTMMEEKNIQPPKSAFIRIICALLRSGEHQRGLDLVKKLESTQIGKKRPEDSLIFDAGIYATLADGRAADALAIFHQNPHKHPVSENSYIVALMACRRMLDWQSALRVYNLMEKYYHPGPNATLIYNITLECMSPGEASCTPQFSTQILHAWQTAQSIFQKIKDKGVERNARTYNAILSSLSDANRYSIMLEIYNDMPPAARNKGTYFIMMTGAGEIVNWQDAKKYFVAMEALPDYKPDKMAYNMLIGSLLKANRWNEILEIHEKMQSAKVIPDRLTYCAIADACAALGDVNRAVSTFQKYMRHEETRSEEAKDEEPNGRANSLKYVLGAAMHACVRARMWSPALDLLQRLWKEQDLVQQTEARARQIVNAAKNGLSDALREVKGVVDNSFQRICVCAAVSVGHTSLKSGSEGNRKRRGSRATKNAQKEIRETLLVLDNIMERLAAWCAQNEGLENNLISLYRVSRLKQFREGPLPPFPLPREYAGDTKTLASTSKIFERRKKLECDRDFFRTLRTKSGSKIAVVDDVPFGIDLAHYTVTKVDGPATGSGICVGDTLVSIAGRKVSSSHTLSAEFHTQVIPFTVELQPLPEDVRDGKENEKPTPAPSVVKAEAIANSKSETELVSRKAESLANPKTEMKLTPRRAKVEAELIKPVVESQIKSEQANHEKTSKQAARKAAIDIISKINKDLASSKQGPNGLNKCAVTSAEERSAVKQPQSKQPQSKQLQSKQPQSKQPQSKQPCTTKTEILKKEELNEREGGTKETSLAKKEPNGRSTNKDAKTNMPQSTVAKNPTGAYPFPPPPILPGQLYHPFIHTRPRYPPGMPVPYLRLPGHPPPSFPQFRIHPSLLPIPNSHLQPHLHPNPQTAPMSTSSAAFPLYPVVKPIFPAPQQRPPAPSAMTSAPPLIDTSSAPSIPPRAAPASLNRTSRPSDSRKRRQDARSPIIPVRRKRYREEEEEHRRDRPSLRSLSPPTDQTRNVRRREPLSGADEHDDGKSGHRSWPDSESGYDNASARNTGGERLGHRKEGVSGDDEEPELLGDENGELLPGWKAVRDPSSKDVYYWNEDTDEVRWERPARPPQIPRRDGRDLSRGSRTQKPSTEEMNRAQSYEEKYLQLLVKDLKAANEASDRQKILRLLKQLRGLDVDSKLLSESEVVDLLRGICSTMAEHTDVVLRCGELIRHWQPFLSSSTPSYTPKPTPARNDDAPSDPRTKRRK
eukprot:CAMPEP_0114534582 /NCGR_PEP_ID=MMETSP0109-20121206/27924_1 /TAXON_ID=29199 /ORGANISM="Chlorarachnion reptans, Strain CCCM449" /LENGTH=2002 /DNA_ID=CAMNT_0001718019 /DNA_START=516 /DNA_END=6524 /DNA_ORIENTATION=+